MRKEKFHLTKHIKAKASLVVSIRALIVCICISFTTNVFAQQITVHITRGTLNNAFQQIIRESKIKIVDNTGIASTLKCSSHNFQNKDVKNILNVLLKNTPLTYTFKNNVYKIIKKPSKPVKKVSGDISGRVVDENGNPIIGATVIVMGTKKGCITNIDGHYNITKVEGSKVNILVSYMGMKSVTAEVKLNSKNIITLKEDNNVMGEVVVTGYQTISKERATGAFGLVNKEQLNKPASNIAERLVGTTAGVQATTNEDGDLQFEIRGQSSLTAVAQPLVVVDGFPVEGGFSTINPNDVESITVLKDAAAASIWGAKSANGVIVVTTKSGKKLDKGKVKVEFSAFMKTSSKLDLDYYNPVSSSADCIDYERKGFYKGTFFGQPFRPLSDDASSFYGAYSPSIVAMNENRLGYLSDSDMESELMRLSQLDNRSQIKDYLLERPFTQQYNLNISSAGEKMNQSLSLMYEGSNSTWKGSDKDRYNFSYRSNTKIYDWLDFNVAANIDYRETDNNKIESGSIKDWSPYEMLVNSDGSLNMMDRFYMPNMNRYVPMNSFPYSEWGYNPLQEIEAKDYKSKSLNYRVQAGLNVKIINGLNVSSNFMYEKTSSNSKNITDDSSYLVRSLVNRYSSWDRNTNEVKANLPKGDFLDETKSEVNYYNWRNQLNFNRNFDNYKHQISAIVGSEISDRTYEYTKFARVYGYDDNRLTVGTFPNGVGGHGPLTITGMYGFPINLRYTNSYSFMQDRYFSLFANASYTYDEKYTLSGSYRTDASNLITDDPAYRYSPFWSVGGSWIATNESFIKNNTDKWLDRLAVRLTYGFNGNVDRSTSFKPLISISGSQNIYIQDLTASISSYGNPNLRWEKTGTVDLGIDYRMFKGLLYGKIDLYNKKSTDLIVSTAMSSVNGTASQKMNAGEMTNRGIEVEIGTTQKILKDDIVFTGGVNFSYNKNVIDKLFKTTYSAYDLYNGGTSSYVQGYNANSLWAFKYEGVVNKGTEANPNMQPVVKGANGTVYDFSGWTPGDGRDYMLNMGTKVAPYVMGVNGSFKIYDFNFSFIFTGKFGHKFNGYQFNYPYMDGKGLPNTLYKETLNADPNEVVPIPFGKYEPRYYFWDRFYPYLDYRVQNASHIRCQEMNLTYNVPANLISKIGIKNARLYVQGNNLFLITNNKYNEDPEHPIGTVKPQPTYTFGINLTL